MTLDTVKQLLLTLGLLGGIGAGMPTLVAAVVGARWPSWGKQLTAIGLSAAVALVTVWLRGELTGLTWIPAVVLVIGAAEKSYQSYWHGSAVGTALERWWPWARKVIDGEVTSSSTTPAAPPAVASSSSSTSTP